MKRCEICRFFAALAKECRRRGPTAVPVGVGAGQIQVMGVFPPTQAGNWCGEFEENNENEAN